MIGQMLGEDHKGNRHIGGQQSDEVGRAQTAKAAEALDKGELRHVQEGGEAHGRKTVHEGLIADDLQRVVAGGGTDQIEDGGAGIAGQNAQDKGDQLGRAFCVG